MGLGVWGLVFRVLFFRFQVQCLVFPLVYEPVSVLGLFRVTEGPASVDIGVSLVAYYHFEFHVFHAGWPRT